MMSHHSYKHLSSTNHHLYFPVKKSESIYLKIILFCISTTWSLKIKTNYNCNTKIRILKYWNWLEISDGVVNLPLMKMDNQLSCYSPHQQSKVNQQPSYHNHYHHHSWYLCLCVCFYLFDCNSLFTISWKFKKIIV